MTRKWTPAGREKLRDIERGIVAWLRELYASEDGIESNGLANMIEHGDHSSDRQANESAGAGDGDLGYNPCCGGDSKACMVNGPCSIERARRAAPRSTTCLDCGHHEDEHIGGEHAGSGCFHERACGCRVYVGGEEGT